MLRDRVKSFGQVLLSLLQKKETAMAELSRAMGHRSKTTLHRIVNDQVNYDTLERFFQALVETDALQLEEAEYKELQQALEIQRLGLHDYMINQAVWQLLRGEREPVTDRNMMRYYQGDDVAKQTRFFDLPAMAMQAQYAQLTVINACSIMPLLAQALQSNPSSNIRVEHYVFINEDAERTTRCIHDCLPMMYDARYTAYSVSGDLLKEKSGGFLGSNWIIAEIQREGGPVRQFQVALLADEAHSLMVESGADVLGFWQNILRCYQPVIQPLQQAQSIPSTLEELADVAEQYLRYEENRNVYMFKADVCLQFVPEQVQKAAFTDGVAAMGVDVGSEAFTRMVDKMYAVQKKRRECLQSKGKVICVVSSEQAIRRFADGGRQSDHLFCMRPYTLRERVEIFAGLREAMRENPYFSIHLLKNEGDWPCVDMYCYEGIGVMLSQPDICYQPGENQVEAMVVQSEFEQEICGFFRREVLTHHVYPEKCTLALLDELIALLEQRMADGEE